MNECWLVPVVAILSFALTGFLRRYAISRSLIDIPNQRSSHTIPTPRGGGLAIVLTFIFALCVLLAIGLTTKDASIALAGAGGITAVIGFLDDHGHIAARWRLLAHFLAAAWGVYWVGGLSPLVIAGVSVDLGWLGHSLALFYLVWMLNLYNFMDGIDGIAGVEAVTTCAGACLIYWLRDFPQLLWPPALLTVCAAGFLCWNFPPAKIFMGDAGSGFLGIILGVLSLQATWTDPGLLWVWLILLGVFIVDATFTLMRRLLRGDKVYEAHRSHAYQFASRQFGKHLPVTGAVGLINVFWLLPIALCVSYLKMDGALGLVVAYLPLVWLAIKFRAGQLEDR
ncbi:MraY family glycosyltransferase [Pseudomonas atacamensis]|uniref:MraY family glycosyltransferase n=1 Tax=Pseudomonas atacamensis TaxID=2565368 RepID=UPI001CBC2967|nr:glycosyltransferase family 4 protein [Pseudomonas atacamensis]